MTVCYFGNYKPEYARNKVLVKGLRENGVTVLECQTRKSGFQKYWTLYKKHHLIRGQYDAMIVGFSGYSIMWLARILTRKPLVFDAFVSLYLSDVEDRQKYHPNSLRARWLAYLDKYSCSLADHVLLDTQAQIDYFANKYSLPRSKFTRIFVGSDNAIFYPTAKKHHARSHPERSFKIHWHGYIVPFHGLEVVIKAAEIFRKRGDIEFRIITGFDAKYRKMKHLVDKLLLPNITFIPQVGYPELATHIRAAHVCLGIFGDTHKAQVVIPNKIFEAAACAKPVITAQHPVISELFTDGENIVLIKSRSPSELARSILRLKQNRQYAKNISQRAFKLYQIQLTPLALGRQLHAMLQSLI